MRRQITYDPQHDYYISLGIDAHASPEEVRQAYRQAVRAVHPDLNPDRTEWATAQLQRINEAYAVLSKPELRRRYDQLRWPHVPHEPRRPQPAPEGAPRSERRYRSPFSSSTYQPDRPWWEQVSRTAPGSYPFAAARSGAAVPTPTQPSWLVIAEWLKTHKLGALEPAWLTLVGLWRSPYGGLLMLLGGALFVNVLILIAAFIAMHTDWTIWDGMEVRLDGGNSGLVSSPAPTATPDQLYLTCHDPNLQITSPAMNEVVGDTFEIAGVVQNPNLLWYTIQVGYLGRTFTQGAVPEEWAIEYQPPGQNTTGDFNGDQLTTEPISLRRQAKGFWVVRLQPTLRDGTLPTPCDVIVLRQ